MEDLPVRIAYFDCIAGITGDTALGALIDAGADVDELVTIVSTLPLEPFDLEIERVEEHQIAATRVTVRAETTGVIRTYASVRSLLETADLPPDARRLAHRMFRLYAEAEARVSRRDPDVVRFHDALGLDTVLALVGVAAALTLLGVERVFSSAVPTGLGLAKSEHGAMPIPSPTVLELLRGVPVFSHGVAAELTDAAGAAILAATVEGYGDLPITRITSVGYGAGRQHLDIPDVLRVVIGDEEPSSSLPTPSGTPDLYLVVDEAVDETTDDRPSG
jgi:pyridinium-3,5-bisthiocarboxylic acid mononucleotide nickel chelatase